MKTEYTITVKDVYGENLEELKPPKGYRFSEFRCPKRYDLVFGHVSHALFENTQCDWSSHGPRLILTPTPKVRELVFRAVDSHAGAVVGINEVAEDSAVLAFRGKGFRMYAGDILYRLHSRREVEGDE